MNGLVDKLWIDKDLPGVLLVRISQSCWRVQSAFVSLHLTHLRYQVDDHKIEKNMKASRSEFETLLQYISNLIMFL